MIVARLAVVVAAVVSAVVVFVVTVVAVVAPIAIAAVSVVVMVIMVAGILTHAVPRAAWQSKRQTSTFFARCSHLRWLRWGLCTNGGMVTLFVRYPMPTIACAACSQDTTSGL